MPDARKVQLQVKAFANTCNLSVETCFNLSISAFLNLRRNTATFLLVKFVTNVCLKVVCRDVRGCCKF